MFGLTPYAEAPVLLDPDPNGFLEQVRGMPRGSQVAIHNVLKRLVEVKTNQVITENSIRSWVPKSLRPLASGLLGCLLSQYLLSEIVDTGLTDIRFTIENQRALEFLLEDVERLIR